MKGQNNVPVCTSNTIDAHSQYFAFKKTVFFLLTMLAFICSFAGLLGSSTAVCRTLMLCRFASICSSCPIMIVLLSVISSDLYAESGELDDNPYVSILKQEDKTFSGNKPSLSSLKFFLETV